MVMLKMFTTTILCLLVCGLVTSHSTNDKDNEEKIRNDLDAKTHDFADLLSDNHNVDDDDDVDDDEEEIKSSPRRGDPFFFRKIRIRLPRNFRRPSKCHVKRNQCGRFKNGCGPELYNKSIGRVIKLPYHKVFHGACNKHDSCYDCIVERRWSRKQCDKRFLRDLIKRCHCTFYKWYHAIARKNCEMWTRIFYAAVRAGGKTFLKVTYNKNCFRSCMNPLANPRYPVTEK